MPGNLSGMAQRMDGRWYIVADNASKFAGPTRFTVAHELGHVFMGHEPSIDTEETLKLSESSFAADLDPAAKQLEVDANYFAAEFLVPRPVVDHAVLEDSFGKLSDIALGLAASMGCSPWVAAIRMQTCGYIVSKSEMQSVDTAIREQLSSWPGDQLDDVVQRHLGGKPRNPGPDVHALHARLWNG